MSSDSCGGNQIVLLSSVIAIQLAAGKDSDETALLGDFFCTIGQNLLVISDTKTFCEKEIEKT